MANTRSNGRIKKLMAKFKSFLVGQGKKLQKPYFCGSEEAGVPDDVKEGHFSVVAANRENPRRFVLPLNHLSHPTFVRLLEQAADKYGFGREGAVEIPCWPVEIESLLAEKWRSRRRRIM